MDNADFLKLKHTFTDISIDIMILNKLERFT
jgi:hypothetical protein